MWKNLLDEIIVVISLGKTVEKNIAKKKKTANEFTLRKAIESAEKARQKIECLVVNKVLRKISERAADRTITELGLTLNGH